MAKKKTNAKLEEVKKNLNERQKRFVHLYLGAEDGKSFGIATDAYFRAYSETAEKKDKDGNYTSEYLTAKTNGNKLLSNTYIQAYIKQIELEVGFSSDEIKRRYSQLANQNKNLVVALSANDKRAKIAGVVKDDVKLDIPQLEELGQSLKQLLTPKR